MPQHSDREKHGKAIKLVSSCFFFCSSFLMFPDLQAGMIASCLQLWFAALSQSRIVSRYSREKNCMPLVSPEVSNEPGLYFEGHFGIRIENLMLVIQKAGIAFRRWNTNVLFDSTLKGFTIGLLN